MSLDRITELAAGITALQAQAEHCTSMADWRRIEDEKFALQAEMQRLVDIVQRYQQLQWTLSEKKIALGKR